MITPEGTPVSIYYKVIICVSLAFVSGAALLWYAVYEYKKGCFWTGWLGREKCYRKEDPGFFWTMLLVRVIVGIVVVIAVIIGLLFGGE